MNRTTLISLTVASIMAAHAGFSTRRQNPAACATTSLRALSPGQCRYLAPPRGRHHRTRSCSGRDWFTPRRRTIPARDQQEPRNAMRTRCATISSRHSLRDKADLRGDEHTMRSDYRQQRSGADEHGAIRDERGDINATRDDIERDRAAANADRQGVRRNEDAIRQDMRADQRNIQENRADLRQGRANISSDQRKHRRQRAEHPAEPVRT